MTLLVKFIMGYSLERCRVLQGSLEAMVQGVPSIAALTFSRTKGRAMRVGLVRLPALLSVSSRGGQTMRMELSLSLSRTKTCGMYDAACAPAPGHADRSSRLDVDMLHGTHDTQRHLVACINPITLSTWPWLPSPDRLRGRSVPLELGHERSESGLFTPDSIVEESMHEVLMSGRRIPHASCPSRPLCPCPEDFSLANGSWSSQKSDATLMTLSNYVHDTHADRSWIAHPRTLYIIWDWMVKDTGSMEAVE